MTGQLSAPAHSAARTRALRACVNATLAADGRPLSIHGYAKATGISARMLIHHFKDKAGVDRAVIESVDGTLRAEATRLAERMGGLAAAGELVRGFQAAQSATVRKLFRTLLTRALGGDKTAIAALLEERARWTAQFADSMGDGEQARRTVAELQGAALDAILDDM